MLHLTVRKAHGLTEHHQFNSLGQLAYSDDTAAVVAYLGDHDMLRWEGELPVAGPRLRLPLSALVAGDDAFEFTLHGQV